MLYYRWELYSHFNPSHKKYRKDPAPMRILIIEDDASLAELMSYALETEGYSADICHDGAEGLLLALQSLHDLILLDRMLPTLPGESVLKRMRKSKITTPVIILTALGELSDKISILDLGADDYLVKPFDLGELFARIRSVLRRSLDYSDPFLIQFSDLRFCEKESKLIHKDRTLLLPPKEAALLAYFFRNPNQTLTRMQIIGNVWGPDAEIEDGNLDNYIYLLRKKLNTLPTNAQIKTVHRQGYCLTEKPCFPPQETTIE